MGTLQYCTPTAAQQIQISTIISTGTDKHVPQDSSMVRLPFTGENTRNSEPHATPGIDIVIILGLEPRWSEIKWTS